LHRTRFALGILLLLAVITVSYYGSNYFIHTGVMQSPSLLQSGPTYPNPGFPNVTEIGMMRSLTVSPACSLNNPPCAISTAPLYYITVNGANYRLIFPNSMALPKNGAHIIVTGRYVTPSTYKAEQWMPALVFRGDIYVQTYSYVLLPY